MDAKVEAMYNDSPFNSMGDNPILHNDPEGDIIPAILIGAGLGIMGNGLNNIMNGKIFFQGGLQAAVIGGITGDFSFGIGLAAASMCGIGQTAFQAGMHALSGGISSAEQGGSLEVVYYPYQYFQVLVVRPQL